MIAYIGSFALKHHIDISRECGDFDIVAEYEDLQKFHKHIGAVKCYPFQSGKKYFAQTAAGAIYESEVAWEGSLSQELLEIIENDKDTIRYPDYLVASLDVLYMLKMSHRYLRNSPHHRKTRDDIMLMRKHGAKMNEEHLYFFKRREKQTYSYNSPKLNKTKAEFFSGDGLTYEFCHDSLHEAVKFFDKPAYQFFSGGEVWSDMDKFETLQEEIKLHAVLEESLVLAAERSQLAFHNKGIHPDISFNMALDKVTSSITSGRFREYAWENMDKVIDLYHEKAENYMVKVREGIVNGIVKKL